MAGSGNNGGDGFVAARLLAERGYDVRVLRVGDGGVCGAMPRLAAQRWTGRDRAPATADRLADADVIVDALFGAGLDRPVRGRAARDHRGDERGRMSGLRRRSAERHQRHHRCGDGRRGEGGRDGHLLPQEARPSAAAGTAALRAHQRRRHRNSGECARAHPADDIPQCAGALAHALSRSRGSTVTNTRAATRSCSVGRHRFDRSRAAGGTRRAARRCRPGDDRVAARGAGGQRGGQASR